MLSLKLTFKGESLSFSPSISILPIGKYLIHILEEQYYDYKIPEKIDGIIILGGATDAYLYNDFNQVIVNDSAERLIGSVEIIKNYPDGIKNLRSRGWSWRRISNKLNDEGVKSKEGKIWYDGSLYNMMRCYN